MSLRPKKRKKKHKSFTEEQLDQRPKIRHTFKSGGLTFELVEIVDDQELAQQEAKDYTRLFPKSRARVRRLGYQSYGIYVTGDVR